MTRDEYMKRVLEAPFSINNPHIDIKVLENTKYTYADKIIEYTCPLHGSYITSLGSFRKSKGCKKCSNSKAGEARRLTEQQCSDLVTNNLQNATYIGKYVKNGNTILQVKCLTCGSVSDILAYNISNGNTKKLTCCGVRIPYNKKSLEQVTIEFKDKLKDRELTIVSYTDAHNVEFKHSCGFSWVSSIQHVLVEGTSCTNCNKKTGWEVYFLYEPYLKIFKIGISINPSSKISRLNRTNNTSFKLMYAIPVLTYTTARKLENDLHKINSKNKCNEYTKLDGGTELFYRIERYSV